MRFRRVLRECTLPAVAPPRPLAPSVPSKPQNVICAQLSPKADPTIIAAVLKTCSRTLATAATPLYCTVVCYIVSTAINYGNRVSAN
jgi:hypothetical protein